MNIGKSGESPQRERCPTGPKSDINSTRKAIKRNAFSGLNKIEGLDLVRNNIENIEAGAFAGLPKLTTINLQTNKIKVLKPEMFVGLRLNQLLLDHNQLNTLNPNVFKNIGLTSVRDNPLNCECYLKMVEITLNSRITGATCSSPENLRNEDWNVLRTLKC